MPQRELEDAALDAGAASDRKGAAELVAALHASGFILRHRGTCFLRPDEIADVVLRALPDSEEEVAGRLEELRAQLAPLERAKRAIDRRARARTRAVLVAGFCLLGAQLGTFLYLTFGSAHWGWDATEVRAKKREGELRVERLYLLLCSSSPFYSKKIEKK